MNHHPPSGPASTGQSTAPAPPAIALRGLFFLAVVFTLSIAQDLLIPIVAAVTLALLLWPVVQRLRRFFVPPAVSAALIITFLAALCFGSFYALSGPVSGWVERAPMILSELRYKLYELREPVEQVRAASKQVEEAARAGDSGDPPEEVVVRGPSLLEHMFGTIQGAGAQLSILVVLLYFLLATGNLLRNKLVHVMPSKVDRRRTLSILHQVQMDVSRYLLTVAMINTGLGAVIAAGFWFAGMPNPLMWGAVAGLLNFMPYVGMLIGVTVIAIVALITFPVLSPVFLVVGIYLGANFFEAQFVTPAILSRRLTLNPVMVFLSVVVWGYLWGVPGVILAVPLLVGFKVSCDNVDSLAFIGEFLSGQRPGAAEPAAQTGG